MMLIVGTSLNVYPAAGLYRYAPLNAPIVVIDPKDVPLRDSRVTHIKAVATKGMEEFKKLLEEKNF
jgi:NAD-dependent deacetylase